ncbi:MAG TPA: hypothetical protein PLU83_13945 [Phycicoccus sp.]|nr:hypothetical protein [Phycicoccus sp.]HRA46306.1 hypothetical protein [Phycicoccus sp.]
MPWQVGEQVEVAARVRGADHEIALGTVTVEDLTAVATNLSARDGANGPQAPMTQWILQRAAVHMSEHLGQAERDDEPIEQRVQRVLSAVVGHEPFVTNTLGLSVHNMRRRWPVAGDWYADLVRYVLRARHVALDTVSKEQVARLITLTIGEFIGEALATHKGRYGRDHLFDLAETLRALWPTYPPVQDAVARDEAAMMAAWGDIGLLAFAHFGLRLRPGVTLGEVFWGISAMVSAQERRLRTDQPSTLFDDVTEDSPGGPEMPYAARLAMIVFTGALEDLDGKGLTIEEMYARKPVAEGSPLAWLIPDADAGADTADTDDARADAGDG